MVDDFAVRLCIIMTNTVLVNDRCMLEHDTMMLIFNRYKVFTCAVVSVSHCLQRTRKCLQLENPAASLPLQALHGSR